MAPAKTLLILLGATLALAVLLTVLFDPEVQTLDARDLADRRDDARRFLVADFVFLLVYGLLVPLGLLRFGRDRSGGSPPRWVVAGALLLGAAGLVDIAENVLLLTATGSPSPDTVDAAHSLAIPKIAFFVAGAVPALAAGVLAARVALGRDASS